LRHLRTLHSEVLEKKGLSQEFCLITNEWFSNNTAKYIGIIINYLLGTEYISEFLGIHNVPNEQSETIKDLVSVVTDGAQNMILSTVTLGALSIICSCHVLSFNDAVLSSIKNKVSSFFILL